MNEKEQEIIDYIMREVVRRSDKQITEDTPPVSSGPFISAREYSSEARRCYPYAHSSRKGSAKRHGHCETDVCYGGTSRQTA